MHNRWLGAPTNLLLLLGLGACQHVDEINTDGLIFDEGAPRLKDGKAEEVVGPMTAPVSAPVPIPSPIPSPPQILVARFVPPPPVVEADDGPPVEQPPPPRQPETVPPPKPLPVPQENPPPQNERERQPPVQKPLPPPPEGEEDDGPPVKPPPPRVPTQALPPVQGPLPQPEGKPADEVPQKPRPVGQGGVEEPRDDDTTQFDTTFTVLPRTEPPPPDNDSRPQPVPEGRYAAVAAGNWSTHETGVAIVGGTGWDQDSVVPSHGSIVHLSTGGSERRPQVVELGGGVDHVLYRIGYGQRRDAWQPYDGVQLVHDFDIGVYKLWFFNTQKDPHWHNNLRGLETRLQQGAITYVTADKSAHNGTAHDSVLSVGIIGPQISGVRLVAHQIELRFHQPDDQRRAYEILSQKRGDYWKGRIETLAEIMGDSLGFITGWDDLGLGDLLPPTDQLPEIV